MQSTLNQASIQSFDTETDPSLLGTRWNKWIQHFKNLIIAMNITGDVPEKALMLRLTEKHVHDIYDTFATEEDGYTETKMKLNNYFSPKKNTQFLVYQFRKAVQQHGEKLDTCQTRLRTLEKDCEFADVDCEIKAQLIQSCTSSRLRRKAMREPDLTLEALLDHGRTLEISEQQAAGIEHNSVAAVSAVHNNYKQQSKFKATNKQIYACMYLFSFFSGFSPFQWTAQWRLQRGKGQEQREGKD